MINTIGTIIRVFWLMTWLIGGWFLAVAALYSLIAFSTGDSFLWLHASAAFGSVIAVKIFYPRNVFSGSL